MHRTMTIQNASVSSLTTGINQKVGPSGFEPESNGPQPSSMDQANPRARVVLSSESDRA